MYAGKTIFSQLMDCLPWSTFTRLVARYDGDNSVHALPCAEQYRAMAFAQLDLPGKPTRHFRGKVPVGATGKALSYGFSWIGPAFDVSGSGRQSNPRLAHLCRICAV